MTIRFNEANLHIVKVGTSARSELGIYTHEINTEAQADSYWSNRDCGGTIPVEDAEFADEADRWLDDPARGRDHEADGLGIHLTDCAECNDRIQQEVDDRNDQRYWIREADINREVSGEMIGDDVHFDADIRDYIEVD